MASFIKKLSMMKAFKQRTPVTKDEIINAEKELGLCFSKEYKEYLLTYGAASVYGHEFTGITSSRRLNVVDVTLETKSLNNNISDDLYVIEETNIDGLIIWQASDGTVYQSSSISSAEKICNSLSEYLDIN